MCHPYIESTTALSDIYHKKHLLVNEKYVGVAKHFSKSTETRDELSTTCNSKGMSRCLSAPDAYITASRRRKVSSGISDVAFASVCSEKTHLKKCMMIMIITRKMVPIMGRASS